MSHVPKIVVALLFAAMALVSVHASGGETPAAVPATQPAAEVMTAAARIPHPPPKAGEVLEMTVKALGNFEYDLNNGGNLPADVKRLNGARIRLRGSMFPLGMFRVDQGEDVTEFCLVPNLDFFRNWRLAPPIQQTIVANCPKGKCVKYIADEIMVEGTLTVAEEKNDNYISSLFTLSVSSVRRAQKIEEHK